MPFVLIFDLLRVQTGSETALRWYMRTCLRTAQPLGPNLHHDTAQTTAASVFQLLEWQHCGCMRHWRNAAQVHPDDRPDVESLLRRVHKALQGGQASGPQPQPHSPQPAAAPSTPGERTVTKLPSDRVPAAAVLAR